MHAILEKAITKALEPYGVGADFTVESTADFSHGDYASNVALVIGKSLGKNPKEVAEALVKDLEKQDLKHIEKIEVAGPGFINFFLSREYFTNTIKDILQEPHFGKGKVHENKKVVVEYTDPNPFKEFHIGHLMPNSIGECMARLYEWSGAEVKRANYQGDVGLHVACAIWGMMKMKPDIPGDDTSLNVKVGFLGRAYVKGATANKENEEAQKEIREINKKVFAGTDEEILALYKKGRQWSLDYFETIYARLGTKFDFYFFESQMASPGLRIVRENVGCGIFEESEGAVIFRGENHLPAPQSKTARQAGGLHTRVFINKDGLPTYEAKELALAVAKHDTYPYDLSVVVTSKEIEEYFKVLLKVLSLIEPELAQKTLHSPHGTMRLPTGKMSSRTGDIITAEALIADIADAVRSRMKNEAIEKEEKEKIIEDISVGALKFAILRQSVGKDIIFDFDTSLSFEGDSGPYLQYTAVRARSVLEKGAAEKKKISIEQMPQEVAVLEKFLARFPEVIERAALLRAPQLLVTYLLELAGEFNTFYAKEKIVGDIPESPYRLALTSALLRVLQNGLSILGIRIPAQM